MIDDLGTSESSPILVQTASGLPFSEAGWSSVPWAVARRLRLGVGSQFGSADLDLQWGVNHDPNLEQPDGDTPECPLAIDALIRLVVTTVEDGQVVAGTPLWHGVVEQIEDGTPDRATAKAVDLGILLARTYVSRGSELSGDGTAVVDAGFCPAFNGVIGGDRSVSAWADFSCYVHDRRGAGELWTAHQIADFLLRRMMRADLPGSPEGISAVPWRLDPASVGDYATDTVDPNGHTVAAVMEDLFGSRRGLTWTVTVADGHAQVLVKSLDATATDLDVTGDLGWRDARVQRRRDGFDYVQISGARPHVGITLWWTAGSSLGSLEPDGWTPGAAADAVVDAGLLDDSLPYDAPAWRRFRLRPGWDGSQYDDPTIGLRNNLTPSGPTTPPNGDRDFSGPIPPPAGLIVERSLPCSPLFGSDSGGPRQAPIVAAGSAADWTDLSTECRPTPSGGSGNADRSDQGPSVILFGDSALAADTLRNTVGASGTLLLTIGVREWAPLQCAWTAPADEWSQLSPRVYHLRTSTLEEWICLDKCVTGVDLDGALKIQSGQLDIRSDVAQLRSMRSQLAVRFGRAVTGITITRHGAILLGWAPGDILGTLKLGLGQSVYANMPTATVEYDFDACTTSLRWSPLITDTPSA